MEIKIINKEPYGEPLINLLLDHNIGKTFILKRDTPSVIIIAHVGEPTAIDLSTGHEIREPEFMYAYEVNSKLIAEV